MWRLWVGFNRHQISTYLRHSRFSCATEFDKNRKFAKWKACFNGTESSNIQPAETDQGRIRAGETSDNESSKNLHESRWMGLSIMKEFSKNSFSKMKLNKHVY